MARDFTRIVDRATRLQDIRNFCIIAHIDHGKSTLADRFIEKSLDGFSLDRAQALDRLQVERDRGITVKSQTVSLSIHTNPSNHFRLNLIDTPGHSDFGFEVTKTLLAAEGAILLIDATKGVQAQTVANYKKAVEYGLAIVPVINKIDLPSADPLAVREELENLFNIPFEKYANKSYRGLGKDWQGSRRANPSCHRRGSLSQKYPVHSL